MPSNRQPERTCVGCRQKSPKSELVRIVRRVDGEMAPDPSGRAAGRGAYLHPAEGCVRRATRTGSLARALRMPMRPDRAGSLINEIIEVESDET